MSFFRRLFSWLRPRRKKRMSSTQGQEPTQTGWPYRPAPTTEAKTKIFGPHGTPNGRGPKLKTFTPPYEMAFAWGGPVSRIGCHYLIAEPLEAALKHIATMGREWIREHGLDLYAGCYNPRKSRGGNSMSDHAWGIAIDLNPVANGLRTKWEPRKPASNGTRQMPVDAVKIFQQYGFQVGFKRKGGSRRDMMHIAYVDRP